MQMQHTIKNFGIAVVQMPVTEKKMENNMNAVRLVKNAVQKFSPKMVVLPAWFNMQYGNYEMFEQYAEVFPTGETFRMFANLAKEMNVYLVAGSMIERDAHMKNYFYNTTVVFSPSGEMMAKYRQMHFADMNVTKEFMMSDTKMMKDFKMMESEHMQAGTKLSTFEIDGVRFGLGLNYDMYFPEMATMYKKSGVDMIIYPFAFPAYMGRMHFELFSRTRAADNQMYVIGASPARYEKAEFDSYGMSMMVDPMGRILAQAGEREEILFHDFDFSFLKRTNMMMPMYQHKRNDVYDTIYKY